MSITIGRNLFAKFYHPKVDYNNLDESDDAHVFKASGYKGEDLCITVDYRVALTNESKTMIQVFPTRHADEMVQLLRPSA